MKKGDKSELPKRLYIYRNLAYGAPHGITGPEFYCVEDLKQLGAAKCEMGEYILFSKGTTKVSFEVNSN